MCCVSPGPVAAQGDADMDAAHCDAAEDAGGTMGPETPNVSELSSSETPIQREALEAAFRGVPPSSPPG